MQENTVSIQEMSQILADGLLYWILDLLVLISFALVLGYIVYRFLRRSSQKRRKNTLAESSLDLLEPLLDSSSNETSFTPNIRANSKRHSSYDADLHDSIDVGGYSGGSSSGGGDSGGSSSGGGGD